MTDKQTPFAALAASGRVEWLDEIDSTNAELKRRAADGAADGTVLIARRQTGGRGRLGRTFFSPTGGLYMSVLLREAAHSPDVSLLTIAAATAVAEAIEAVTGQQTALKWVNDVYLHDRKVCGILAEAIANERGALQGVVLGFGVNITPPSDGFPDDLRDIAGALFDTAPPDTADRLAEAIIDRLMPYVERLSERAYLTGYRRRSMLDGKTISFCENGVWHEGEALGIDDDGGLMVRLACGDERVLRFGEVTLHREKRT